MQLLIATTNEGKLREIRRALAHVPIAVLGLGDFPAVPEPDETGATFEANARLKAQYYDSAIPGSHERYTVGEDSGLIIDALDGDPGVRSARFLGPDATYSERFAEIARRLAAYPDRPRTARFVCAVAVVHRGAAIFETSGTIEGEIAPSPRGSGGFGYDPVFVYPPLGRTLAELDEGEKQRVGHRGQAFRQVAAWLTRQADRAGTEI